MDLLSRPVLEEARSCSYIPGRTARYESFLALNLDSKELEKILHQGWRKFGCYYFRPACPGCFSCEPVRIKTQEFRPSKSQRQLLRRNSEIEIRFMPRSFREELFTIYDEHSRERFGQNVSKEDFLNSFYLSSCPDLQSEYYLKGKLVAAGFLDQSENALSSVYFVLRPELKSLGLGILSILKEIEYAAQSGLEYYYLGYYVAENSRMSYKNRFFPYEKMSWNTMNWSRIEK
jgi:arginine-tRNA-protein transferase